jgi:Tfp pilus assembly protein PilN
MFGFRRALAWLSAHSRRQAHVLTYAFLSSTVLQPAFATEGRLDLPAQPLGAALITLATEADVSIGLSVNVTGKTARPLKTYTSFEDALSQILAGSGLTFEKIDQSTYRIY